MPETRISNSPAIHRRGHAAPLITGVPEGRLKLSSEYIFLVERNSVCFQKYSELVFEIAFGVVLGLAINVRDRPLNLRNANREGTISFLPCELLPDALVQPLGRSAFDHLYDPSDGDCGRRGEKHVNMICGATDGNGFAIVGVSDAADVSPEFGSDIVGNTIESVLR